MQKEQRGYFRKIGRFLEVLAPPFTNLLHVFQSHLKKIRNRHPRNSSALLQGKLYT